MYVGSHLLLIVLRAAKILAILWTIAILANASHINTLMLNIPYNEMTYGFVEVQHLTG